MVSELVQLVRGIKNSVAKKTKEKKPKNPTTF